MPQTPDCEARGRIARYLALVCGTLPVTATNTQGRTSSYSKGLTLERSMSMRLLLRPLIWPTISSMKRRYRMVEDALAARAHRSANFYRLSVRSKQCERKQHPAQTQRIPNLS